MNEEPLQAFPYLPPDEEIKIKYKQLFLLQEPIKPRLIKTLFDKVLALILLLISAPVLFFVIVAYRIEGIIIKENAGPIFFFYWAISHGKRFKKWKIRLIKTKFINQELAKNNEWAAFSAEWNEDSRTYVGSFVKKWYLDEIPQFWSVLNGDISIVGPRPLSVMHYDRDIEQGNVTRKLVRGGMLGLGHIHKGTNRMGLPDFEYEYVSKYKELSSLKLFMLDLNIIYRGIKLMLKGGGH